MPDPLAETMAADTLERFVPALSATSDMPVLVEPEVPVAEAVVEAEVVVPPVVEPVVESKPDPRTVRLREREEQIAKLTDALGKATDTIKTLSERPKEPEAKPEPPAKPIRDQFADPDSYEAALVEWAAQSGAMKAVAEKSAADEKARAERDAADKLAAEQKAAQDQALEIQKQWTSRVEAARQAHPDYVDVVERDDLQISGPMAQTLVRIDNGPEIAYWLGKNPAEAGRIAALTDPVRVIFELGAIGAKLSATPASEPVTRAPDPIVPLRANAAAAGGDREPTMEEYAARRLPVLRAERRPSRAA